MATPQQLRADIDLRLETVPNNFFKSVGIAQDELFDGINAVIQSMDTVDGVITNSARNIRLIQGLDGLINEILIGGSYYSGLATFGSEMITQGALVGDWFSATVPQYTQQQSYQTLLANTSKTAIDKFTSEAVDTVFNKPLKDIINQSITTRTTTAQVTESISDFIRGNDQVEGKLLRYSKQIGRDAFSVVDRQLTEFIADDLGMTWFLYAGDTVKDSREFCIHRVGKYFHRNEIEGWANLTWQGKAPVNSGTIFVILGGYNCLHVLLPVNIEQVPQDVIDRNINNGNYEN